MTFQTILIWTYVYSIWDLVLSILVVNVSDLQNILGNFFFVSLCHHLHNPGYLINHRLHFFSLYGTVRTVSNFSRAIIPINLFSEGEYKKSLQTKIISGNVIASSAWLHNLVVSELQINVHWYWNSWVVGSWLR